MIGGEFTSTLGYSVVDIRYDIDNVHTISFTIEMIVAKIKAVNNALDRVLLKVGASGAIKAIGIKAATNTVTAHFIGDAIKLNTDARNNIASIINKAIIDSTATSGTIGTAIIKAITQTSASAGGVLIPQIIDKTSNVRKQIELVISDSTATTKPIGAAINKTILKIVTAAGTTLTGNNAEVLGKEIKAIKNLAETATTPSEVDSKIKIAIGAATNQIGVAITKAIKDATNTINLHINSLHSSGSSGPSVTSNVISDAIKPQGSIDTAINAKIKASIAQGGTIDTKIKSAIGVATNQIGVAIKKAISDSTSTSGTIGLAIKAAIDGSIDPGKTSGAIAAAIKKAISDSTNTGTIGTAINAKIKASIAQGGTIDTKINKAIGAATNQIGVAITKAMTQTLANGGVLIPEINKVVNISKVTTIPDIKTALEVAITKVITDATDTGKPIGDAIAKAITAAINSQIKVINTTLVTQATINQDIADAITAIIGSGTSTNITKALQKAIDIKIKNAIAAAKTAIAGTAKGSSLVSQVAVVSSPPSEYEDVAVIVNKHSKLKHKLTDKKQITDYKMPNSANAQVTTSHQISNKIHQNIHTRIAKKFANTLITSKASGMNAGSIASNLDVWMSASYQVSNEKSTNKQDYSKKKINIFHLGADTNLAYDFVFGISYGHSISNVNIYGGASDIQKAKDKIATNAFAIYLSDSNYMRTSSLNILYAHSKHAAHDAQKSIPQYNSNLSGFTLDFKRACVLSTSDKQIRGISELIFNAQLGYTLININEHKTKYDKVAKKQTNLINLTLGTLFSKYLTLSNDIDFNYKFGVGYTHVLTGGDIQEQVNIKDNDPTTKVLIYTRKPNNHSINLDAIFNLQVKQNIKIELSTNYTYAEKSRQYGVSLLALYKF